MSSQRVDARQRMQWFSDWSVRTKILLAVLLVALTTLATGGMAIDKLAATDRAGGGIYSGNLVPLGQVSDLRSAVWQVRLDLLYHVVNSSSQDKTAREEAIRSDDQAIDAALQTYQQNPAAGHERTIADFSATLDAYRQLREKRILPASRSNDDAAVDAALKDLAPIAKQLMGNLQALDDAETAAGKAQAQVSQDTYRTGRTVVLAVMLLGLALAVALALWVARLIVWPIRRVSQVLQAMAGGDLTRTARVSGRDEVGAMAADLNTTAASLRDAVAAVAGSSETLASAAEELSATSSQISSSAQDTAGQATVASSAAEEVSHNVATVSAGAEQMGASIREIAQNAADAARVASSAVEVAGSTNATVTRLGKSSEEIFEFIKVITSIAEQTNLLALNATIEAARAGEAGKGFAVVAGEVKELAQETARAAEDISRRVAAIQTDTGGAVAAIGQISAVIAQINDYQTTIASAVEEQTATTQHMTRSVAEAAAGSNQIASSITGVADGAQLTTAGVSDAQAAANELARMSSELRQLVGRFQYR